MLMRYLLMLVTLTCPIPASAKEIVVEMCSFQRSHASDGIMTFDDYGYRILSSTEGLSLEARYADKQWHHLGQMDARASRGHRTYVSRNDQNANAGVMVLSITNMGRAVLLMHYEFGGAAVGSRNGVMFQGDCQRP